MRKVNTNDIPEETWTSPKGKYVMAGRGVSEALGRVPTSLDLSERHPFDVEIQHIPAGAKATVFHSHSAQWEFYHVISGNGTVRYDAGTDPIVAGDAFLFKPGEAHQIVAGSEDLFMYVVADNPIGESTYHHDTGTASLLAPERKVVQTRVVDYFEGEE